MDISRTFIHLFIDKGEFERCCLKKLTKKIADIIVIRHNKLFSKPPKKF